MAVGLNSRPTEWSRPPEPHPPDAGCWCSRNKRRPYVSLIWCSTPSGHGNGLRPWIRNNGRRTAYEPLNLTLDLEYAHVSGLSLSMIRRRRLLSQVLSPLPYLAFGGHRDADSFGKRAARRVIADKRGHGREILADLASPPGECRETEVSRRVR